MTERLFRWLGQGMPIVKESSIPGFGQRNALIPCDRMSRPSLIKIALSV
jgi:hypothetical protein